MDVKNKLLKGLLIAIVDDDASVRNSTRRLLQSTGLQAEAFASAEDFLQSGRLDEMACVILDMRMPGMSGLEMQQRLIETGRPIPIVFLSARASEAEKLRALQSGAADFLNKPVSQEVLLDAIHTALEIGDD